jgi:hypothetical protein
MRRIITRRASAPPWLSIVGASAAGATGVVRNWTNTSGGSFNLAGNWSGVIPGPADSANFNLPYTYSVTFDASPTKRRAHRLGRPLTFRSDTVASREERSHA